MPRDAGTIHFSLSKGTFSVVLSTYFTTPVTVSTIMAPTNWPRV